MSRLTAKRVEEIATDCVWPDAEVEGKTEDELKAMSVVAEGILHTYAFRPAKIEEYRDELRTMINDLPLEFLSSNDGGGGGWSFLNLCMTRDGEQWTGLHLTQERLVCLCIAAGLARFQLPRAIWQSLPGGMPYVVFGSE